LGCRDTIKTTAKVYDDLKVDFDFKQPICAGSPMQFENLSSFGSGQIIRYRWDHITVRGSNNFSNLKDPIYNYTYTDTVPLGYSILLTVTTDKGCTGFASKVPFVYPKPNAYAGKDTVIGYDTPYEMPVIASPQNSYFWSPSTGLSDTRIANPTVTGGIPTCYIVKVWGKDSFCTSMDTVCIKYGRGPDIHVPTAFSPNGDGINDRLYFRAVQVQVTQIAIFNRWGQTVFSSTNPNQYWDGTFQGRLLERDQYNWLVKGIGPGNKPYIKEGSFLLLR
jgi:gliding motility-associated-like protein